MRDGANSWWIGDRQKETLHSPYSEFQRPGNPDASSAANCTEPRNTTKHKHQIKQKLIHLEHSYSISVPIFKVLQEKFISMATGAHKLVPFIHKAGSSLHNVVLFPEA